MSTETRFENGNLIVTRVYPAARKDVFDAWVATHKVQQWWGCAMCTSVRSEVDPRVGGRYNHHMTIDGVGEVPGLGVLTEFDPPSRLAYRSPAAHGPEAEMLVTVEFTEVEGGTLVRLVHSGIPDVKVEGDMEMRVIVRQGWTAAFDKLFGFLAQAA